MTDPGPPEVGRAGRAFRAAVDQAAVPEGPSVSHVRRGVLDRRRRLTFAVSSVALVVLAVGIGLLPNAGRTPSQVAAPAEASAARPGDPAPPGWRTDYYRDVSFEVPQDWVYAYEPGCADEDQIRTRYPGPYVSLGHSPLEAVTLCESVQPDRNEHVAVTAVEPGVMIKLIPEEQVGGVWVLRRHVGLALVTVTGPDEARARRIVESIRPAAADAPCSPRSPLDSDGHSRPEPGLDLSGGDVEGLTVCQYEPGSGLRAALPMVVADADPFLDQLRGPAGAPAEPCEGDGVAPNAPAALSLVVRITVDEAAHGAYVVAGDCRAGYRAAGLIDDGRSIWALSREACRAVITGPVRLISPPHELEKICALEPVAIPTAAPPEDPAPPEPGPGWRTEYYRNVAFQVPATWGYADAPNAAWCAGNADGRPDAEHRKPYVSLGGAQVLPAIACPDIPPSLITEHVAIRLADPAQPVPYAETQTDGWWVVTADAEGLRLAATSRDRERARRIVTSLDTAPEAAPCPARHPLDQDRGVRPDPAYDLSSAADPGAVTLCQYEPPVGDRDSGGLRAALPLKPAAGAQLFDRLRSAPAKPMTSCTAPNPSEIRVAIRFTTPDGAREVYVAAAGCPDGYGLGYGGIEDGTTVRALTRDVCRAVLTPPLRLEAASGDVGRLCLTLKRNTVDGSEPQLRGPDPSTDGSWSAGGPLTQLTCRRRWRRRPRGQPWPCPRPPW